MSSYTWIKLYVEILDDVRLAMMSDYLFRRFILFLLVAGRNNQNGLLGPVSDLAWRLRSSENDMLNSLRTMSEVGIVAETPDGWRMVDFAEQQAAMGGAERMQQYRKRRQASREGVTDRNKECNENGDEEGGAASSSTSTSSSTSISTSSSGSDYGEGGVEGGVADTFAAYEQNIGRITPLTAESLRELEQTYSSAWVAAALREAVRSNAPSLAYMGAILRRWKRDGFESGRPESQDRAGKKPGGRQGSEVEALVDEFLHKGAGKTG